MKRTPGKTPAARERYWTKIILEARKYPKGVTEYCRVMNISKNNYYFWFKRLRKNPERFVRGAPRTLQLPPAAWINPPDMLERKKMSDIIHGISIISGV